MSIIEITLLALALAIDAGVVSFSQGLVTENRKYTTSLSLACWVGVFQAAMPCLGWVLAKAVYDYIAVIDHWIAFIIFFILGSKFIYDALIDGDDKEVSLSVPSVKYLFLVAVATSIDAFAAGATLYFVNAGIIIPASVIGIVTFFVSLFGFWAGNLFKKFPSKFLEILAGIILICLGFKVLIEHKFC